MKSVPLGAQYRLAALGAMAEEEFDVLVIGGGVTGAGVALDAVTRGLSVAVVEARDWAAGTSSRSSKLIHGGLRYLEQLDFALVREALRERGVLLHKIAPHLVQPVPFLLPLEHHVWERAYIGSGVMLYDTLGGARALPMHRHLTKKAALRKAPGLKPEVLVGAIQYYDAQVDDARYTMTLARTAAQYGAQVATRARVTDFLREGKRVTGAVVRDLESGEDFNVKARRVICATGVWTDDLHELANVQDSLKVRASKGVHIVVPKDRIDLNTGLISRTEKSVLFIIPWDNHWLVGTTDTDWDLDLRHPAASAADIEYLLEHANALLTRPLTHEDIVGVYAGLRPLVSAGANVQTTKLSREHMVTEPAPGLFVIAGGKYTTYRVMAKDVVDAAAKNLGGRVPESVTDRVGLLGADGYVALWNERERLARNHDLPLATVEHLLHRYGSCIDELFELIDADPELAKLLGGAGDYLRVEAVYAATHEGALHLVDILARRTRISIEVRDRGVAAAHDAAALVAPVLGWDEARREAEVELYLDRVKAELDANSKPDDASADKARLAAKDLSDAVAPHA
jgi:glycerol-3-phosphate dehydrogenase